MYIDVTDLLGVPYKVNGRDLDGLDCMGLAIEVERRFGHELIDLEDNKHKGRCFPTLAERTARLVDVIEVDKPDVPSDMILFMNEQGFLHHIGIYLGDDMFIHCDFRGVHIDHFSRYPERIGRIYRWQ